MRITLQRVSEASVEVESRVTGSIRQGILVLAGFEEDDTKEDIDWVCNKMVNLRIFDDENGIMNLSVKDVGGEILVISQFTLHASTKKGNRPSYIRAAKPDTAIPLYEKCLETLSKLISTKVQSGVFGAHMNVSLVNDGPVTINIDSKNKE